jgi:hypothetical protein
MLPERRSQRDHGSGLATPAQRRSALPALRVGAMTAAAPALRKNRLSYLWGTGGLEVSQAGKKRNQVGDLLNFKHRPWDGSHSQLAPHVRRMIPHGLRELQQCSVETRCRDPIRDRPAPPLP